jgi:hypothetical protein
MKAGHDRPDRYPRYLGDLAVAKLVQLAQNEPSREHVGGIEMRQRYRLEATPPIGIPRLLSLRDLFRFPYTVDRERSQVETTGTRKTTEPLFRAGPFACAESICQY